MKREEILNILEGKEGSGVLIKNIYTQHIQTPGVFVGTRETLAGTEKPDSLMLMYRNDNGVSIDTVYIDDSIRAAADLRLDITENDGKISISYDKPPLSGHLHTGRRDYDALQKLVEEHGL